MLRPKFPDPIVHITEPAFTREATPEDHPIIFCACPTCDCDRRVEKEGEVCELCRRGAHQEH